MYRKYIKRILDFILASILLVVLLPFMLILAMIIKRDEIGRAHV